MKIKTIIETDIAEFESKIEELIKSGYKIVSANLSVNSSGTVEMKQGGIKNITMSVANSIYKMDENKMKLYHYFAILQNDNE